MFLKNDKIIQNDLISSLNIGLKLIKSIDDTFYQSYDKDKIIQLEDKDFLDADYFFTKVFSFYNNSVQEFKTFILEKHSVDDYHLYFNKYTDQNKIDNLELEILNNFKSDQQLDIKKIKILNFEKLKKSNNFFLRYNHGVWDHLTEYFKYSNNKNSYIQKKLFSVYLLPVLKSKYIIYIMYYLTIKKVNNFNLFFSLINGGLSLDEIISKMNNKKYVEFLMFWNSLNDKKIDLYDSNQIERLFHNNEVIDKCIFKNKDCILIIGPKHLKDIKINLNEKKDIFKLIIPSKNIFYLWREVSMMIVGIIDFLKKNNYNNILIFWQGGPSAINFSYYLDQLYKNITFFDLGRIMDVPYKNYKMNDRFQNLNNNSNPIFFI